MSSCVEYFKNPDNKKYINVQRLLFDFMATNHLCKQDVVRALESISRMYVDDATNKQHSEAHEQESASATKKRKNDSIGDGHDIDVEHTNCTDSSESSTRDGEERTESTCPSAPLLRGISPTNEFDLNTSNDFFSFRLQEQCSIPITSVKSKVVYKKPRTLDSDSESSND